MSTRRAGILLSSRSAALWVALTVAGCGSPASNVGANTGGSDGKNPGTGGTVAGSGGVLGTGGAPGTGGNTGGGVGTGGDATGGANTEGTNAGGTTVGTGGRSTGGSAAGGNTAATGGQSAGGNTAGGNTASGGQSTGGGAAGGNTATGGRSTGGGTAGASGSTGGQPGPSVVKDGEVLLTNAGLTILSYGGYLNGESFQQDGIVSYNGYQYAAFWNTARNVVLGRRMLPSGAWSLVTLTDYTNTESDAHNTISLGVTPGDGTLHLSFDHHGGNLHYRKSVADLVTSPTAATWVASSFSAVTSILTGNVTVTMVTYPRFVTEPDGNKMLFEARIGGSGSGDEYLWEYDSATHSWTSLGRYVNGTVDSINAYPHGLSYGEGGTRLHLSWCWRETPDAQTNHDLIYVYSDDHGRNWKNNAGTTVAVTGSLFVTQGSPGIKVWTINQNRGLINQEHMAVDAAGRVHVLLSHMPDSQADDANFDSSRTKSQYFHYWRNPSGTWARVAMGFPSIANFRGKLAIASSGNLYAILPDLRIAAASVASNFSDWALLNTADSGRFFSDPLIDTARLLSQDKLSIVYPQESSPNIYVLDYTLR
jgi:BNR repeat-containing family member